MSSSRCYQVVIVALAVGLGVSGTVAARQQAKLRAVRSAAETLFFSMRALEIEDAHVERLARLFADPQQAEQLARRRAGLAQLEKEYDGLVEQLSSGEKVAEDERVIRHVARVFGESDVGIPAGFVPEVRRYIERWKSSGRLGRALQRLQQSGYTPAISRAFANAHLPEQFVFLALQESDFDDRAVGPATRYGFAKGMWQFIVPTARRYGLHVGSRYGEPVYDPEDERFDWRKATAAAARYLADIESTDAQGSGLLTIASYNWGEDRVRGLLSSLPEDPRHRSFWRVLADRSVPGETYDYVLSIFSAAVICERPHLFGFDGLPCPVGPDLAGATVADAAPGR